MKIKIEDVKKRLYSIFTDYLKLQQGDMNELTYFNELGVGSVNAVELTEMINNSFNLRLPTSIIFEFRNLLDLSNYIESNLPVYEEVQKQDRKEECIKEELVQKPIEIHMEEGKKKPDSKVGKERIAIIGISCRCAGANNQREYWEAIANKKECIEEIKDEKWVSYLKNQASIDHAMSYGKMENIEKFDPLFFNISPIEANAMDPAQRILLEECYRALQDANYPLESIKGKEVGTIIGTMGASTPPKDDTHYSMIGYDTSILAARIAYFLDLKGATMAVNTACSSALVAIDLACNQLLSGTIDMAISGGINVYAHPKAFVSMENAGMLSKTQSCKPFDKEADGIVVGDGVGIVILKRLSDAERDKDYIYGIIDGIGINQDGATNGITVPSFQSQSTLEKSIYQKYGIDVKDIQYIETHGTATKLGDPVEIQALTQAFRSFTEEKQYCAIGSVKANIGHTAAAAGVLSLIKILLSMKYGQMAPTIHYHNANEQIDLENSPFYVNDELRIWPVNKKGRRVAAVSAFGLSGTNAHLVIEDYDNESLIPYSSEEEEIFAISSHRKDTLREYCLNVSQYISEENDTSVKNIAFSLMIGREQLKHRFITTYKTKEELLDKLNQFINQKSDICYNDISKMRTLNLSDTNEGKEFVRQLLLHKKYDKLTEIWLYGSNLDWKVLFDDSKVHKLSGLPEYVFCKDRCYVPMDDEILFTPVQTISEKKYHVIDKEVVLEKNTIKDKIKGFFVDILQLSGEQLDETDAFIEFGLDSVSGMSIVKLINEEFQTEITFRALTDYDTLEKMTEYIFSQIGSRVILENNEEIPYRNELSIGQKGIWIVNQIFPKDSSYNIINAFKFRQRLNKPVLQKAFDVIIKENKLLSSVVEIHNEEPYLINTVQSVPIQVIDCSSMNKEGIYAIIEEKATIPFSLDKAPLLCVYLMETGEEENILLTVAHHLIFDGKSLMIVIKELLELYSLGMENKPMRIMKTSSQYGDFVMWQKQYLSSTAALKDRDYWIHELDGKLPVLKLAETQNGNSDGKRITKKVFSSLSEDLSKKVNEIGKQYNVSNFVLLLSAFNMMLHKVTNQSDILVGTVLEGRPKKEFEDVVGCFMNIVALRSKIEDDISYLEYIKQIKEHVLDMIDHGNYPFSEVVNESTVTNKRGESPLFDVTFILHNWFDMKQISAEQPIEGSITQIAHLNDIYQSSMYDLLVEVFVNENKYEVSFKYNGYRFKDEMIQNLCQFYLNVLECLINDITTTFSQLELQDPRQDRTEDKSVNDQVSLEESIVSVYQEVLQKTHIDKNKNFFEMGGNSMKLVKAALKLKDQLRMDIEPTALFAHPTVHKLVEYLNRDERELTIQSRSKRRGLQRREILGKLSV